MKRTILTKKPAWLALLAILILFGGCGKKDAGYNGQSEKVVINYVYWGDASEIALNEYWIKEFETKYPNIKVNKIHVAGNQGMTSAKILTMVAGGDPPDVMYAWPEVFADFCQKNVYLPLDSFLKDDRINRKEWYPEILRAYTYNNSLYGLPRSWHPLVLYYNKTLFDQGGVSYPDSTWTWDTVIKYGQKLTKDINGDGKMDQFAIYNPHWEMFIWSAGGKVFDEEGSRCFLDDPRTIAGLQLERDLIWKHRISPSSQQISQTQGAENMFITGRIAMYPTGLWVIPQFRTIKNFQWDIAVVPAGKIRKTKMVTAGWGISSITKHPRESWEFVKYLTGSEAQEYQMKLGRDPSALTEVFEKYLFYEPGKPPVNRQAVMQSIKFGQFSPVFAGFNEIAGKVNEAVDKILFFEKCDVKKTCEEASAETNKLIQSIQTKKKGVK